MPIRFRHTLGPLICYHGCDRTLGEAVLAGEESLRPSENDYDWLGPGIYFWVDSRERALEWAETYRSSTSSRIKDPFVIGAYVVPGLCLNLTDYGVRDQLRDAYQVLVEASERAGTKLPENSDNHSGIMLARHLDCAVIRVLHQLREKGGRKKGGDDPYDSVYGVFEEGKALYTGAGIREKTHVQIAVRNPEAIIGYFRPTP